MMYHGQTTIGHLPRWLGDDGNITYGTRIPHIVTFTAASGSLTSQEMETLYSTSISNAGITKMGTSSVIIANGVVVQETQSSSPGPDAGMYAVYLQQQTHKEIVAGSVVGSFMGLVIVLFVVGVLIAWRKKVEREKEKLDEMVELRGMEAG
jgi:hypothetical protein